MVESLASMEVRTQEAFFSNVTHTRSLLLAENVDWLVFLAQNINSVDSNFEA